MLQVKASKAVFCFHAAHQRDWVFTNEPLCYLDPAEGMRTLLPMVALPITSRRSAASGMKSPVIPQS